MSLPHSGGDKRGKGERVRIGGNKDRKKGQGRAAVSAGVSYAVTEWMDDTDSGDSGARNYERYNGFMKEVSYVIQATAT